jgi:hypothetical protein
MDLFCFFAVLSRVLISFRDINSYSPATISLIPAAIAVCPETLIDGHVSAVLKTSTYWPKALSLVCIVREYCSTAVHLAMYSLLDGASRNVNLTTVLHSFP